jgi:hypothetical protein
MNRFKKGLILGVIRPEETEEIITPLTQRLFNGMTSEERLSYLEDMIPKFVKLAFLGLKGQEKADASKQLMDKLIAQVTEVNTIEVKWLETPADQRAEINCC